MMTHWSATNVNPFRETISDPDRLPYWYVVSRSGIYLERDDGEIRTFRKPETARVAADKLNKESTP